MCVFLPSSSSSPDTTFGAAGTGAEAVAALEQDEPSVAILDDLVVPDISGYEICPRLRARYGPRTGVLFVSGERTEAVDRVAALLIGGDDYLVKPFAIR